MSPTIVLKGGKPLLSLGAAGGPTIISQTVVNLINLLDYQMPLDDALQGPRIHHQWKPDELRAEALPEKVKDELLALGHSVVEVRKSGASQIVLKIDAGYEAAHDPRLEGKAAGW
jgi:gamma-glutamyltranspeptidase/glutathione hydrolase